jgi:hypothetical protein
VNGDDTVRCGAGLHPADGRDRFLIPTGVGNAMIAIDLARIVKIEASFDCRPEVTALAVLGAFL